MKIRFLTATALACSTITLIGAPLTESTFTEVVRDVNVVATTARTATAARVNEVVKAPDLVRTGPDSRAELTAPDQTLTRIGANSVFAFEPSGRNLRLDKGSVLFHSPGGKGGGTIKTGGASAAILGTTVIVAATEDGGFKFIVLEGRGRATLANGRSVNLRAGQMVFILPGGTAFSEVLDINLGRLVAGSQLINGFSHPLVSLPQIQSAVHNQNRAMESGRARDTGISADDFARAPSVGNGFNTLDAGSYRTAVHPPLTPPQIFSLIESQGRPGGGPGGAGVVIVNGAPVLN